METKLGSLQQNLTYFFNNYQIRIKYKKTAFFKTVFVFKIWYLLIIEPEYYLTEWLW